MEVFESYSITEVVPMRTGKNMLGHLPLSQHLQAAKDLRRHCRCHMGTHRARAAAPGTCYSSSWQEVAVVATCCSSEHEQVEVT
ncbi:unnamed protein product, partial [Urochloa humidicola]